MKMEISKELAQEIVSDMKNIIHQDINYINTDGIIIASTNTNRIGAYHGGGKRVSDTKNNVIIQHNAEYTGAQKGINLPIYFESTMIGVIGITGSKQEVEKYGEIIRRMTELLIKDAYTKKLKNKKKETQRMLIEELLFNNKEDYVSDFTNRTRIFNIQDNIPRVVVIFKNSIFHYNEIEETEKISNLIDYKIMNYSNISIMQNKNNVILIMQNVSEEDTELILKDIAYIASAEYGLQLKFGIGIITNELKKLKDSYEKANIALSQSESIKGKDINFYSEIDIGLIVENLPKHVEIEFCKKVMANLDYKDIREYKEILNLFERFNGSIKQISNTLFIHKNTLQYKLDRLYNKIGYDMRKYKDFVTLKIAFLLIEKVDNKN